MNVEGGRHVKMWTRGVPVDEQAKGQLANMARMPFVHSHLAVMPDVHVGKGATVGSVIATKGAIIPAAVGVDIGCGMMAVQTTLKASDLPESLAALRARIERAVPHGFVTARGRANKGSWGNTPDAVRARWGALAERHDAIAAKYPTLSTEGAAGAARHARRRQPLHRGLSRHRADRVGDAALRLARHRQHDRPALHRAGAQGHEKHFINLPDRDLAYLVEGTEHFDDYVEAMDWAQDYAAENRRAMMDAVLRVMREELRPFQLGEVAVNCHHNYVHAARSTSARTCW